MEYRLDKVPNYRGKWLASEKNLNFQAEISEAALQELFRMWKSNQDLFHMQQSNVYMLWVLLKS